MPYEGSIIKLLRINDLENMVIPIPSKKVMKLVVRLEKYKDKLVKQEELISLYIKSIVKEIYGKIIKNGREFYKFRICDEFEAISGKGSFNKMKKEGLASEKYDLDKGFIYPIYSGSTIGEAINGYSKTYNFDDKAIKVSKDGAGAGSSIFISGKTFNASGSFYLISKFVNSYTSLLFNWLLPSYSQGSTIPHVYYRDF